MVFGFLRRLVFGPPAAEVRFEKAAREATSYEEWKRCQKQLDELRRVSTWVQKKQTSWYGWETLQEFMNGIHDRRVQENLRALGSMLRRFRRSMSGMTDPILYRHSFIRTKQLIHDYVREVRKCIDSILENAPQAPHPPLSEKDQRELIDNLVQIMGRSTLVLQGGAGASMCHLGVVKALHKRRLLPKIITGSGIGSLAAALVGTTPDHLLLNKLLGESINLQAFQRARTRRMSEDAQTWKPFAWVQKWRRRIARFRRTGHAFDINVIEQFARDNLDDITFDEAHNLTGRTLNITTPMAVVRGTPQLLNHITAPHVLIRSAVAASVATSKRMYAPATLYLKEESGRIIPYFAADYTPARAKREWQASRAPLGRIGELFNCNHFIFSQTRPYIAPFVRFQAAVYRENYFLGGLINVVYGEILYWLKAFGILGWNPTFLRRVFMDEDVSSSGKFPKLVITPDLSLSDWLSVFKLPTSERIDYFADKGERSVWPFVCAIKMRCTIEFELDAAWRKLGFRD